MCVGVVWVSIRPTSYIYVEIVTFSLLGLQIPFAQYQHPQHYLTYTSLSPSLCDQTV